MRHLTTNGLTPCNSIGRMGSQYFRVSGPGSSPGVGATLRGAVPFRAAKCAVDKTGQVS